MNRKTIKVFVNNVPLVFLSKKDDWNNYPNHDVYAHHDDVTVDEAIEELEAISTHRKDYGKNFVAKQEDPEEVIISLRKRYKYIEAAGGLVLNDKEKVLMIHRLGVWDLPKGKLDTGETPRKAAIREIEEECGIGKLKIIKSLPPTYHIYTLNGKRILKKTFWFKMIASDTKKPIPQVEEHIDEVCWMSKTKMKRLNPKNTYRSILDVLSELSDNNSVGKK